MSETSNKLIFEKSPYLLQHAHNPIQWYPWGHEAFSMAKALDKPIFLSIGYSTCHWCHVMEQESFSNEDVARLLNKTFVCIKVDKEEQPEVDALYMEFAQMLMSSSVGWPLNVILTPELKPFYAITYLPPHNRSGMLGLCEIAQYIFNMWHGEGRDKILSQAQEVIVLYQQMQQELSKQGVYTHQILEDVFKSCLNSYDPAYGGKKGSPKFPYSHSLSFYLEYHQFSKSPHALEMAEVTMQMMYFGGIYDHLQGGFARYSIDDKWMIPHFEKMLSDNALLAKSYIEAYLLTKKPFYKKVSCEILDFILAKLLLKEGGFGCALDADTKGQEGLFYTWTEKEIDSALDPAEAALIKDFYNVTPEGNFEGRNVLFQSLSLEEYAEEKKLQLLDLELELYRASKKLLHQRDQRAVPFTDDKVILSWNCQTVEALLIAGYVFQREDFKRLARQTIEFLWERFYKDGILYRRSAGNQVKFVGNLDDYAWMIQACFTFFRFGEGASFYQKGMSLLEDTFNYFGSKQGFYHTMSSVEGLVVRRVQRQDGAAPAAQSVLCAALIEAIKMTPTQHLVDYLHVIFDCGSAFAMRFPENFLSYHHMRLREQNPQSCLMVIVLDPEKTLKQEVIQFLSENYLPFVTCVWKEADEIELLAEKPLVDGQTTIYICSKNTCFSPVLTVEDAKKIISGL